MHLPAKLGGRRSYGNEDTHSYINFWINALEKVELTASVYHNERFQNQEYQFTISKLQVQFAENEKKNNSNNTDNENALWVSYKCKKIEIWR